MLKQLRIKNFKCWKDTGSISLAPITLFFGANSSGKSSIGQFLMMLKQTVESPDRKTVFYPGGKNTAVKLGSYKQMVYGRKTENKISFEYEWEFNEKLKFKDPISEKNFSGNTLFFNAEVRLNPSDNQTLVLDNLHYQLKEKDSHLDIKMRIDENGYYNVEASPYELRRKQGRVWQPGPPSRFYGFPEEVVAYYQNAEFVQDINLRHEQFYRSLFYLGPLRSPADRLYSWAGNEPESVGHNGENTIPAILAAKNKKISLKPRGKSKTFAEIIASKLKDMGLIEKFDVEKISEQRQEYEVKIHTKGSEDRVDLPDVGFGISQVLPVLVQCFYAPNNSIIIMEQPEIHLHPSAQSALADVIIDVINSRTDSTSRNIQLIIETHSEHFLRRLQRRIAEGKIEKEKVSAYFANNIKKTATLEKLEIDSFGSIKNWPQNFFGDEMEDVIEQSKAAIKQKQKQMD